MSALEQLINAWPKLNAEKRIAVYRSDPDALDLAWRAADNAKRKRFVVNTPAEANGIWNEATLKPLSPEIDIIKQAEEMRKAHPGDAAVQNVVPEFQNMMPFVPRSRLPKGVGGAG